MVRLTTSVTVAAVAEPEALVAASHLFDSEVSTAGATAFLAQPGHVVLLATSPAGDPVGFVSGVEMRHPDKGLELFVYELGVDEPWRRRGVAAALLRELASYAEGRGARALWTATESDNLAALATYRSRGFRADPDVVVVELPLG